MCGVFGVYGSGFEAARITHSGLWALQHRGQESSGIVSSTGKEIFEFKGMGLVSHVYDEKDLRKLKGHIAIGHNRYSTSGGSSKLHCQPVIMKDKSLALAHNGNLPTTYALETFLKKKGVDISNLNDSEMMYEAIRYYLKEGLKIEEAVIKSFPLFTGAFSLVLLTKNKLIALRDRYGIRPLSIGNLNGGYIVSSETCALDIVGADFIRAVTPGEMIVVDDKGLHSYQIVPASQKLDIFEFVYFARPDSILLGRSVYSVRYNLGKLLFGEHPIKADMVIPIPDSAVPAAIGFSEASGIPLVMALVKNRYIHRTFIRPDEHLRKKDIQIKLNPIKELIAGKDIVLIDDSIVRGSTIERLVTLLKKTGARRVHVLSSSPQYLYPDFYGINTPKQSELIAANLELSEIKKTIGADSLHYLSYENLIKATGLPESVFCTSCFTGVYPIDIGENKKKIRIINKALENKTLRKPILPISSAPMTS